jgi:predicted transcriptional regulator of viral defense system
VRKTSKNEKMALEKHIKLLYYVYLKREIFKLEKRDTMTENKYKGLSKDEIYFISRAEYESQKTITTAFSRKVFPDKIKASDILTSLKKKGRILCIEKGTYLIVPIKAPNQRWTPNEYLVAALWLQDIPYYIGYASAYNYWGFTEQIPQNLTILNTQRSLKKTIGSTKYRLVKVTEEKIYGIRKIKIEDEQVKISDKERTLVDFIYNPIGSWHGVKNVLREAIKQIDEDKFIRYLIKFPVGSVRKRSGFILEQLGIPEEKLEQLEQSLTKSQTYIAFNPFIKSRKGKVNKKWQVIISE